MTKLKWVDNNDNVGVSIVERWTERLYRDIGS